ncbi:hypothetical protein JTE90_006730 [Oedothorax gibbosus]|uniref:Uncharacterized protein n=1 Tax=Oedothorax gibbosus TaxID=931172 RepID=A0AAV6U8Y8_9ARAC|nr:hypothetical protein JTE90_006730 [Oedothorax gibbosus]
MLKRTPKKLRHQPKTSPNQSSTANRWQPQPRVSPETRLFIKKDAVEVEERGWSDDDSEDGEQSMWAFLKLRRTHPPRGT